jgi:hypothetical protein
VRYDRREPSAAPNPAATAASNDTLELFIPRPIRGVRKRIEAATGERAHIKNCHDATGKFRGVRAIFNRPTREARALINQIMRAVPGSVISRVDIAVDFHAEGPDDADAIADWLDLHLILKWRSPRSTKMRVDTTVYWCDGRRSRNLVVYRNRKSDRIVRLELRFLNSRAVRRAGLDTPEKIQSASPLKLIDHNVKAARPSARYVERITRQTYQDDLRRHLSGNSQSHHAVADYYRSRIPYRVRSIFTRADAQSMRIKPSGMERISTDWLGIPMQVTWPALKDKGNSRERREGVGYYGP